MHSSHVQKRHVRKVIETLLKPEAEAEKLTAAKVSGSNPVHESSTPSEKTASETKSQSVSKNKGNFTKLAFKWKLLIMCLEPWKSWQVFQCVLNVDHSQGDPLKFPINSLQRPN